MSAAVLNVVCAWCGPRTADQAVSHGICPACRDKMRLQVESAKFRVIVLHGGRVIEETCYGDIELALTKWSARAEKLREGFCVLEQVGTPNRVTWIQQPDGTGWVSPLGSFERVLAAWGMEGTLEAITAELRRNWRAS